MDDLVLEQKFVIDDNVRFGNIPFLIDLLHEIHGEPTAGDDETYLNNPHSTRHDILFELSAALVRYNAADVFQQLCVEYEGKADIPNLPSPYGGNLIDLASDWPQAEELCEAVRRNGGVSFPVKLRTQRAQELFRQWHDVRGTECASFFLQDIVESDIWANDILNVLMATAARLAQSEDWHDLDITLGLLDFSLSSEAPLETYELEDMRALLAIVNSKENFEASCEIRDMIRRYDGIGPALQNQPAPGL